MIHIIIPLAGSDRPAITALSIRKLQLGCFGFFFFKCEPKKMELKRDFERRTEKGSRMRETSQQGNCNVNGVPTESWKMQMQFSMPGKVMESF